MLIGIVADSHDNLPLIKRVVRAFNDLKVSFVVHAGDFIAPFALAPLDELKCPWIGVFGNNDGDQANLTRASRGRIQPAPFELNLDGKKVFVVHDIEPLNKKELVERGAELIISGHSHQAATEKVGTALFVNPGELGGWLHGKCTYAVVNTEDMSVVIEELEQE